MWLFYLHLVKNHVAIKNIRTLQLWPENNEISEIQLFSFIHEIKKCIL